MDSYTFGSQDFMMAVLEKQRQSHENYPITLNQTDFRVFVTILQKLALYAKVTHKDIETIPGHISLDENLDPLSAWAWDWLSGIAETLDVEGI